MFEYGFANRLSYRLSLLNCDTNMLQLNVKIKGIAESNFFEKKFQNGSTFRDEIAIKIHWKGFEKIQPLFLSEKQWNILWNINIIFSVMYIMFQFWSASLKKHSLVDRRIKSKEKCEELPPTHKFRIDYHVVTSFC